MKQTDLLSLAEAELLAKLESGQTTAEEITEIETRSHRFIPAGVRVPAEKLERLRALARLSRCSLQTPAAIKSHRPVIGQLIVALKRMVWPFVQAQLRGTLKAQEQFNILNIKVLASEIADNSQRAS